MVSTPLESIILERKDTEGHLQGIYDMVECMEYAQRK